MINKTDMCEQLSNDGRTCTMIASYEGHFDILQLLRNHINQRSDLLTRCDLLIQLVILLFIIVVLVEILNVHNILLKVVVQIII